MESDTDTPMDSSPSFCPNPTCCARGQRGQGNIVIHDRKRQRYRCKICKRTFSAKQGTMFEGLRKPRELITIIVTLLSYGCPIQAIVHAYGLDERTVADWRDRAGRHCQRVHQSLAESGQFDLVHVQADELRVKGRKMIAWMGLALMVSTKLWLAGTISLTRDKRLADRLMQQVRACSQPLRALLVCTDGWAAAASIARWARSQHALYRTLEWHHAGASGSIDPQMSACSFPSCRSRSGHVLVWGDVQFLLAASGTLQIDSSGTAHHSRDGGRLD